MKFDRYQSFFTKIPTTYYRLDGEYLLCANHITLTDCKLYNKCLKTWCVSPNELNDIKFSLEANPLKNCLNDRNNAPGMTSTHHNGASVNVVRNEGKAVYMIGGDIGSQFI